MGRNRGKKDRVVEGLNRLMSVHGNPAWISSDLVGILAEGDQLDDRAAALVFASLVERALEQALTTFFITTPERSARLFAYSDREGPLATFSAKIAIGEALGIYEEKMRKDLNTLRGVRNVFAHSRMKITFDTEEICEACDSFIGLADNIYYLNVKHKIDTSRKKYAVVAAKMQHYLISNESTPLRFTESHIYSSFYP